MIDKLDLRIITLMVDKTEKIISIIKTHSREEIESDFVLSDALQYEFEKLYEDSMRLSFEFRNEHKWLHIDDLRSIRNRVAHNYESVSVEILLDTAEKDIAELNHLLREVLEENS